MKFNEFCEIIRDGMARGKIKCSIALSDLDLAITYAIGMEMEEQGGREFETTVDEIYYLIGKHCGIDVRNRIFADEEDAKDEP